jgi:thiol-disulfide isomerase/thioredoxin
LVVQKTVPFSMQSCFLRFTLGTVLLVAFATSAWSSTLAFDNPSGIAFFRGSWKTVVAEAKRQNKPIFLDIYTTWCPPCKRMAKEAFPNPKVGAKFNVHFINYQLDAEKGEGIEIAKRYAVSSYPTALYITPNGDLIHRSVGYGGVNAMIDQANHMLALPQFRATIAKGDKDYANGRRDAPFLRKYLATCKALNRPIDEVLDAYLDALPEQERSANESISFIAGAIQSSNTKAFDFLIKNRPDSVDSTKQSVAVMISDALARVLVNDFEQACVTNDEALLESIIANSERNIISANPSVIRSDIQKQEAADAYRLKFSSQTKNLGN